ncbi:ribosome maturation factor RimP [Jatrophihabitans sp.]|uniref:ribosome maturation factor RimP n=1 Tax=Jatrophihabitans sp. TaxID=1932789 RepID=UPI002CDDB512|nr:ribosome maturation factor RimP [Jatrophihabitans sp.]
MTARTPQRQQLIELIGPVVSAAGYELDDLSVTAAGRRSLIRVSVDGDRGIDLDAVARISRTVSDVLDADGAASFAGPYVLEVSSPGVDRPLTEPRHWRRATGRLVTVDVDGRPLTGRVVGADDSAVQLDVEGRQHSLPLAGLGPGRVQVEFSRPGDPGPDETQPDDTELDDTELDEAELDEAELDEAEPDETESDEAEPDEGGRSHGLG